MIFWVFAIAAVITALVFGFNLRGLTGAIMLGITVLIIDHTCLWLRIRLLRRTGTSINLVAIMAGFIFRIINIAVFLLIGAWWLVPAAHPVLHWILIIMPFWNLLGAVKLFNKA